MTLKLIRADWAALFPKAHAAIIDAFAAHTDVLDKAGITANRTRLAYTLANVEHESGGFTVKNLTENLNYSAERMAEVFEHRVGNAQKIVETFGTAPGWQKQAFDIIYGNRMGNRPGTDDGSRYIGRGGPQITGRDGYAQIAQRTGLDLVGNPELATLPENQPAILAAFYRWKNLSKFADNDDFKGFVKAWNGGRVGMEDRKSQLSKNAAIIHNLKE